MKTNYELALEEYNQGSKLINNNNYDNAIQHFQNAQVFIENEAEKEDANTETLILASKIYIELFNDNESDFQKAIKYANKALNKKEENMEHKILAQLSFNYYVKGFGNELDKKAIQESYNYLKQIKKPELDDYRHLIRLISILDKQNELEEILENALEIDPEAELADTMQEEDMLDKAIEYTIKTAEKHPNKPEPYHTLAMIFMDEAEKEKNKKQKITHINNAHKAIMKAYNINKENPETLTQIILILENDKKITRKENQEIENYYQELKKIDTEGIYLEFIDNTLNNNI